MTSVPDYFGCDLFDDRAMRATLPAKIYKAMRSTIEQGEPLDDTIASAVADAMRDWAVEKGATHFTHWFQPLTGITAEKHDSFIERSPDGGMIMDFSGKELIKGEPDASSFPSGGLRATFEARGYTAWDPTSCAFVKGKTLYIPTAFCSYTGEALDKKTPLLRSMEALNIQALRVLRLLGDSETKRVRPVVGAEQEYFLIPKELFEKREDLRFAGRTLFGAPSPKGQELDDHYFGAIPPEVASFMEEVNERLWKLGIPAKTEHNEVAPSQHELACIYDTANIATDQNQLVMEILKETAEKHGFACLLHEKPFAGVNGSGKHNNWSLATDTGVNLLSPGKAPQEDMRFQLFLCAVIRAVDKYQDLLRLSVATASNDHRLGGNEAPPAVISMFIGDDLFGLLKATASGVPYEGTKAETMELGSQVLPDIYKDNTDRNRTSPFAFTGNKFEFRMPGSSDSIACANIMLNSAVAESLKLYADRLEQGADQEDVQTLIKETMKKHGRIIFNGNGYEEDWLEEAERRGLLNLPTTPDCLGYLLSEKNVSMLTGMGIYSEVELKSRYETVLENYCKTVLIEAKTMVSIAIRQIIPAVEEYEGALATRCSTKTEVVPGVPCAFEKETIRKLAVFSDNIYECATALSDMIQAKSTSDWTETAGWVKDKVLPAMASLRTECDLAEVITSKGYWPFPTYGDLMFSAR
ncbi:MAG: glutamine synthetase III [Oscillospiraceae bacterium]|nr:glutamine synthetase III [Oscillospiraceae bacterium]